MIYGGGNSETYDYYIDATDGNDANNGSLYAPWKTLSKITGIPLAVNATVRVLIKQGTYNTADDYVIKTFGGLNSTLYLIFEPNCIMDGTSANAIAATNGFEFSTSDSAVYNTIIYGNGLIVRNYSEATALSPNGVGNRGVHKIYVHNVTCTNCDDGFSAHDDAHMYLYDCSASGSEKGAFIHVGNAYCEHHRCVFTCTTSTGYGSGTPTIKLFDCVLIPATTSSTLLAVARSTYTNCQIGTLTQRFQLSGAGGVIIDSFVNCYLDGNGGAITFTRCYGKSSFRVRQAGGARYENCVFTAPTTGFAQIVFSNFNGGGNSQLFFRNNIVESAVFMSVDATNAAYLVNGVSQFFNNDVFGATFDADLVTADSGGTVIVGNISADALIGAGNTLNPDDYGYAAGSPAIGAGTGGTNIGFAVGEVAPPAPQQMLYQLFV
jgi:hypothetical protein